MLRTLRQRATRLPDVRPGRPPYQTYAPGDSPPDVRPGRPPLFSEHRNKLFSNKVNETLPDMETEKNTHPQPWQPPCQALVWSYR